MGIKEVVCVDCGARSEVEAGPGIGRISPRCDACRIVHHRKTEREKQYRWRAANPEKWHAVQSRANAKRLADPVYLRQKRERQDWLTYGLEPAQVQALLDAQEGCCAICGKVSIYTGKRGNGGRLHIDHDHTTGRIRGLLCGNCNTMLGLAKDDPDILARAIRYLHVPRKE